MVVIIHPLVLRVEVALVVFILVPQVPQPEEQTQEAVVVVVLGELLVLVLAVQA